LQESIASKRRDTIQGLSLSGCEEVTDEVFLVLHDEFLKSSLQESVVALDCTGCVHLTDISVKKIVDLFPKLKKVK
jgi:predicted xylose isomerase-like sugar epimerase